MITHVGMEVIRGGTWFMLALAFASCTHTYPDAERVKNPTALSQQLVVVQTDHWDSATGVFQCYERERIGDPWKKVGDESGINVGKSGLAWGSGLHGTILGPGPAKREGDGKAPAGVFRLRSVFGYAPADSTRFLKMPYIVADSTCQCVDDPNSEYYNLIVDKATIAKPDWASFERMRGSGIWYKWGVVVEFNMDPRMKGNGSCIFLHIWDGPSIPTEGCTSFDEDHLVKVIHWLDESKNPVLVQFPRDDYSRLRASWRLP